MMFPSFISLHYPLISLNWFETGGEAEFFSAPLSLSEYQQALCWAGERQLPVTVLGAGANVLISDEGVEGLVIKPCIKGIEPLSDLEAAASGDTVFIRAGAGEILENVIEWCLKHHVLGLEEFSGIPGTIGGSVYINVHYFKFLLSQFLYSARVICKSTGTIQEVDNAWFTFGYNTSMLLKKEHFLVDAVFALKKCSSEEAAYGRGRSVEIIRHRKQRYPYKGTCGSFFRNFHEHEVSLEQNGRKLIFVGYYLDRVGVKGSLTFGNAGVSYQHANMIVNFGQAKSSDIIAVARQMQELVYEKFGILPLPECELIGFQEYPLLKHSFFENTLGNEIHLKA